MPVLMPEAQQTLEDASVTSDGVTTLTFTKLLWATTAKPICDSTRNSIVRL
jgi:hypothetical protein